MLKKILGLATLAIVTSSLTVPGIAQNTTTQTTKPAVQAPTPGSYEDFRQTVGDTIYFDFDKIEIKPGFQEQLDKAVAWMKKYNKQALTIEGHTDERGTREYNLALGERRAQAVRKYLASKGMDPNLIHTISYGKERPAVAAAGDLAWMYNRRAVLFVQ